MSKQQRLLPGDHYIVLSLLVSWSSALHPLNFLLYHDLFSITLQQREQSMLTVDESSEFEDVCGFTSHLAEEKGEQRSPIIEAAHQPLFPLSLDGFGEA